MSPPKQKSCEEPSPRLSLDGRPRVDAGVTETGGVGTEAEGREEDRSLAQGTSLRKAWRMSGGSTKNGATTTWIKSIDIRWAVDSFGTWNEFPFLETSYLETWRERLRLMENVSVCCNAHSQSRPGGPVSGRGMQAAETLAAPADAAARKEEEPVIRPITQCTTNNPLLATVCFLSGTCWSIQDQPHRIEASPSHPPHPPCFGTGS